MWREVGLMRERNGLTLNTRCALRDPRLHEDDGF